MSKKAHRIVKYMQQMPILFKSSWQEMKINLEFQNWYYECGWKPKSKYILLSIR